MLNNSHLQTWSEDSPPSPDPPAPPRRFLHYYFDSRCRSHAVFDCPICIADHGPQQSSNTFHHRTQESMLQAPPYMPYFAPVAAPLGTLTAANQWREKHPFSKLAAEEPQDSDPKVEKQSEETEDLKPKEKPEQVVDSAIPEKETSAPELTEIGPEPPKEQESARAPSKKEESTLEPPAQDEPASEPPAKEDISSEPPRKIEEIVPQSSKQEKASRVQRLRTRVADIVRGRKLT